MSCASIAFDFKESLFPFWYCATCSINPTHKMSPDTIFFFTCCFSPKIHPNLVFSTILFPCKAITYQHRILSYFFRFYLAAKQIDNILNKSDALRGQCFTSLVLRDSFYFFQRTIIRIWRAKSSRSLVGKRSNSRFWG